MTANFALFTPSGSTTNGDQRMRTSDLQVGQTLIRVRRDGNRWNSVGTRTETKYTIAKILKTRLVLVNYVTGAELRVVVIYSPTYTARNGLVADYLEGDSEFRFRNTVYLYTEDDAALLEDRANFEAADAGQRVEREATAASKAFVERPNAGTAAEALIKLQVFADYLANI